MRTDLAPAVELLQRDLLSYADEWCARCVAVEDEPPLTTGQARAVVALVAYTFERSFEPGSRSSIDMLEGLLLHEPSLSLTVNQLSLLRETLHRSMAVGLPTGDVILALECLNRIIDSLLQSLTQRAMRDLEREASIDQLTKVGNRRALIRHAARELPNALRHGRSVTVLIIDIDGLKAINDEQGHDAGDATLRRLAEVLVDELRAGDAVYRIGGDEFVVVLPDTDYDQVPAVLSRSIALAPPFSFGVATLPGDGTHLEALLTVADTRLYSSRRGRRGTDSHDVPLPRAKHDGHGGDGGHGETSRSRPRTAVGSAHESLARNLAPRRAPHSHNA